MYSMTLEEPASCCDSAKNRELAVSKRALKKGELWLRGREARKAVIYDTKSLSKGSTYISERVFVMDQRRPISAILKSA